VPAASRGPHRHVLGHQAAHPAVDGAHVGTVYGEVVSGDIQKIINKKGELISMQTRIDLQGTGGTGIFDNEESQKINGSLNMTTDLLTKKKKTIAVETLNF